MANKQWNRADGSQFGATQSQRGTFERTYERRQQDPEQRRRLAVTESEGRLLAIDGMFDHWSEILPLVRCSVKDLVRPARSPEELPRPLRDYHVVVVGCPGSENGPKLLNALLKYVREGGHVLTTDLCLGNVLTKYSVPVIASDAKGEVAELVTHSGEGEAWLGEELVAVGASAQTAEMVDIELAAPEHPLLRGVEPGGEWFIETASHLIDVRAPQDVNILMRSKSLEAKYGFGALLFMMKVGRGTLVHFVSHAYAQSTDEQGAQAAAMILANFFDLATHTGKEASRGDATHSTWLRLVASGGRGTHTIYAQPEGSSWLLDRALARKMFPGVADGDGDQMHVYIDPGHPILEIAGGGERPWVARVPAGGPNGFLLNGVELSAAPQPIAPGSRLVLYKARSKTAVDEIEFVVEGPPGKT